MQKIQEFLEGVLPSTGMICIVGIKGKVVRQEFYATIPEAVKAAVLLDSIEHNAYFACATFKDNTSRKQENVAMIKSFFVDIDCGADKPYKIKEDGLIALQRWCKELKLPRPTLVDSGRGLHAYWVLEEAITREEWQPVADVFKASQAAYKFYVDPAVSADSARILRVPGTHNYKDDIPSDVVAL
jgi:hypothetical protein